MKFTNVNAVPPFLWWVLILLFALLFVVFVFYHFKEMQGRPTVVFVEGVKLVTARGLAKKTVSRTKTDRDLQFEIGEVPVPAERDNTHFLLAGATGTGKSTLFRQLLPKIQKRGHRAIVMDINGEFAKRYKRDCDFIFRPGSQQSIEWNPIFEVHSPSDIDLVVKSILPRDASADSESWNRYARTLLKTVMLKLMKSNELNLERLRYFICEAGDKELSAFLLEGEDARRQQQNNMTSTVRSMAQFGIESLELSSANATFSIRQWVREGSGIIYLTPSNNEQDAHSGLINALCNVAIAEALSAPPESRNVPLYLMFDELASFRIDDLQGALEKGRKFGLCVFAGLQNIAQLRQQFGKDGAAVLLSNFRTKIIFNPGDAETAKSMSEELGKQVINRLQTTFQTNGDARSSSQTYVPDDRAAVSAERLLGLPDLHAFVQFGGTYQIAKVVIPQK